MNLSKKDLKEMLYWVVMGRRLEERITVLFKEGRIRGHHHPGIGQEAANVGACHGLKDQDYVLLADLMEYELLPMVREWQEILRNLAQP